jgi:hypothetical protein
VTVKDGANSIAHAGVLTPDGGFQNFSCFIEVQLAQGDCSSLSPGGTPHTG